MIKLTESKKKELEKDFLKYEKYIYSILGTNEYHSKVNSTKGKVNIYNAKMLGMEFEDLVQQGRIFLWEALLQYGIFPKKYKNKDRKIASKSTFVYRHLYFQFINLGIKANSKKYKRQDIDISEIYSLSDSVTVEDFLLFNEKYSSKIEKEIINNKKYLQNQE